MMVVAPRLLPPLPPMPWRMWKRDPRLPLRWRVSLREMLPVRVVRLVRAVAVGTMQTQAQRMAQMPAR